MKNFARKLVPLCILAAAASVPLMYARSDTKSKDPTTFVNRTLNAQVIYLPRPQGLNSAAFFDPYYYDCCDTHDKTAYAHIGYRYNRNFDTERLASCLFGSSRLDFAGSLTGAEFETALTADYLGLAPNLKSTLSFNPIIQNNIVDFYTRWDLGQCASCLENAYVALGMSIVNSKWDLGMCERGPVRVGTETQFDNFPACYMSSTEATAAQNLKTVLGGKFTFGDMQTPWKWGKFDFCSQDDTKVANFDMILGYDFLRCDRYHVGLFAKASAPTGTRPNPEWVFQPMIGNGHHWELGGGLDAHWTMWSCNEQCLQAYLTGSVTHLFGDTQRRSFDFKTATQDSICNSGFFSRYMLLKEFDADGVYNGNLINAINFTTRQVKASFDVQGDASFRLLYKNCGWAFGLGYNIFGRSTEKIEYCGLAPADIVGKRFGIKGTSGTCARGFNTSTEQLEGGTIVLNATESQIRMFNFDNPQADTFVDYPARLQHPTDDFEYITWYSPTAPLDDIVGAFDSRNPQDWTGAPAPVILTDKDINFCGVPRMITHKVFGHIDYQWDTCCCWQPYVGIGGEAEFTQAADCAFCTPRFWGVWIHGGINF